MIGSEGRKKILFWKLYGYLKFMSFDIVSSKIKIYFINLKTFTMINILDLMDLPNTWFILSFLNYF